MDAGGRHYEKHLPDNISEWNGIVGQKTQQHEAGWHLILKCMFSSCNERIVRVKGEERA
jgi:hypothetical protein